MVAATRRAVPDHLVAIARLVGVCLLYAIGLLIGTFIAIGGAVVAAPEIGLSQFTQFARSHLYGLAALIPAQLLAIGAVLLATRWIDRRPVVTLGLWREGAWQAWLRGAAIAAVMMCSIVLVWYTLVDGATWSVNPDPVRAGAAAILGLLFFLAQGPGEEILFRGYILQNVTLRWNLWWGVGVSTLLFAIFHGLNANFGLLPFINLLLFGVVTALYKAFVDGGRLWGVFAIHTVWNWLQQVVFGLENSGLRSEPSITIFHVEPNRGLPEWVWGGGFGPEGTAATTLALLLLLWRCVAALRSQGGADVVRAAEEREKGASIALAA
jgi:uncharacterized protein